MAKQSKKQKQNSKYPERCHKCQFYDVQKDKCTNDSDKCTDKSDKCKTDYSLCDNFLIKEKLVMY